MKQNLLEEWKEEYFNSDRTYQSHVTKFVDYIVGIGKANQPTKITKEDLVDCIGHYYTHKTINTISSMALHLESVKAFYKFLVEKGYTNDIFNNTHSFQLFKDEIISKYNLSEPKSRGYWEGNEIIDILKILDDYFDRVNYLDLKGINEKKKFNKFLVLRLFIKLTLIAPTKRSIICSIKNSNFSDNYRTVDVNGTKINVPNGLRRDILYSIKLIEQLRKAKITDNENIFDFLYMDNFRAESINEFFYTFLKTYEIVDVSDKKGSFTAEIIMDSALYEMVKNNVNPALIAKINGQKISRIEEKFYENGINIENSDQLINEEISRNIYYKYI